MFSKRELCILASPGDSGFKEWAEIDSSLGNTICALITKDNPLFHCQGCNDDQIDNYPTLQVLVYRPPSSQHLHCKYHQPRTLEVLQTLKN